MTNCCPSSNKPQAHPKKYKCPVNGKSYSGVSSTTIIHHINEPWNWNNKQQGYYFCNDPECEVVYFGEDDSTINKSSLRTEVGIKETNPNALICYCFGVSKIESSSQAIKDFVIKNTQEKICACTTRNPSGRCCLKDFH
ncbi:putative iron-sulfur cluster-binding metallochaperone [Candidatus Thiodubiliella endoseptemdiera]|uniref:putative iron-sulfur cluster-binding metallochaperone n=1 Tax=Candidatus Thiodubiliella endoseptemdiera TaxID=2738886 RepID=UPI0034E00061